MVDGVDISCGGAKVDGYGYTGAPAVGGQMTFSSYHGTTLEGGGRRRKARRSTRRVAKRSARRSTRRVAKRSARRSPDVSQSVLPDVQLDVLQSVRPDVSQSVPLEEQHVEQLDAQIEISKGTRETCCLQRS